MVLNLVTYKTIFSLCRQLMAGKFVWTQQEKVDAPEEASEAAHAEEDDSADLVGVEVGEVTPEVKTVSLASGIPLFILKLIQNFSISSFKQK